MKNYILVTGASTGIGYATVAYFIKKGFHAFGSVRKQSDADRLQNDFPEHFTPLIFDVTDAAAVQQAVQKVAQIVENQGLSLLVNNAGIAVSGPMAYVSMDEMQHQFEVNVFGLLRTTQAFLPLLGFDSPLPKGKIINVSSGAGRVTRPFMGPYAASKHAVESISDALRRELLPWKIDVVVIQPGPIQTDIWNKAKADDGSAYAHTPYGDILKQRQTIIQNFEKAAIPAERVAALIYQAYRLKRPKTRYVITPKWFMTWLAMKVLPDRWLDGLLRKEVTLLMKP